MLTSDILNNNCDEVWSHTQIPTAFVLDDDSIKIFYSSRDTQNRSHIFWADVSSNNPQEVLGFDTAPILSPGLPGAFDDAGVMPSSVVVQDEWIYLYYIGWSKRDLVPYHNAVGVAVSDDFGKSFSRKFIGPIIDRSALEPYFNGTSCVKVEGGLWRNWYMSCVGWSLQHDRMEPRYHLKYAESSDGFEWIRRGDIAIDFKNSLEGGICRATILKIGDEYNMWFCYRGISGYRERTSSSYRIGYAKSMDGKKWLRQDDVSTLDTSGDGWDSFMQAYPDVVSVGKKTYMFYNGNGFGMSGIGLAELSL